jgi:REP element-mobilizing transposase RayT
MYRRNLPHFRRATSTYFVTWRLNSIQPDLTHHERTLTADALHHFNGQRYTLIAFVVMNDHVHVMTRPMNGRSLESLTHSWKSYTANQMQRLTERSGQIWQAESFDRIPRGEEEFRRLVVYMRENPRKRWPWMAKYPWWWISDDACVWARGAQREALEDD